MLLGSKKNIIFWYWAFSLTLVLILIVSRLFFSTTKIHYRADTSIILEGSWRYQQGIFPAADYPSVIGPITPFFTFIGNVFFKNSLQSIDLGLCILFLLLSILVLLASKNLNKITSLFALFSSGSFLIMERSLNYPAYNLYLALYNHIGLCFLFVFYFLLFQDENSNKTWSNLRLHVIAFLFSILFFTKIPYAFFALGAIVLYLIFRKNKPKNIALLSLLFVYTITISGVLIKFHFINYFSDFFHVLKNRFILSIGNNFFTILKLGLYNNAVIKQILYCVITISLLSIKSKKIGIKRIFELIYILITGIVCLGTITQPPEFAFESIIFIIVIGIVMSSIEGYVVKTVLILTLSIIPMKRMLFNYNSLFKNSSLKIKNVNEFKLTDLKNRHKEVKDLIGKNGIKNNVLFVDFGNPYNFALKIPSTYQTPNYWHYGVSFSENSKKINAFYEENNLFRFVKYIFISRNDIHKQTSQKFMEIYGEFIYNNYKEIHNTENWILYCKKENDL